MKKILYIMSLIALTSCMSYGYTARYDIKLRTVEVPKDTSTRYGEYISISYNSEDATHSGNNYSDKYVDIKWEPSPYSLALSISNKTPHTITVHWDKAVFVSISGIAQPIIHNTIHAQTSIPRHASILETLMRYDKNGLIPVHNATAEDMRANANRYKGHDFRVTLPIEIHGAINEYIFIFRVGEQQNIPISPVDYSVRHTDPNDYR